MQTVHRTPRVAVTDRQPPDVEADLLIVPAFEDDDLADLPWLDSSSGGEVVRARERGEFKGKPFETLVVPLGTTARRAMLIGAGPRGAVTADRLRRVVVTGALAARTRRQTVVAVVGRAGVPVDAPTAAQAMTEGAVLANFEGASYKTDEPSRVFLETVQLCLAAGERAASPSRPDDGSLAAAVSRGLVLAEASNVARELANEPGNALTPAVFADRARAIAESAGLAVDVLDERRMAELKMGMLLGVARGSQEPPRLLVMRHEPAGAAADVVLGLVGKGVTFDTGGISIKPAENMDKMKDDMSGGAAVIAAMSAIARLNAPVRCLGVVPMTENMPGGRAVKPGDILTSAEGKTVEVLNTDAEGRLILGDALWHARQLGATHLVDVATLTGACVVALGKTTSGLFGAPDAWVQAVQSASERAGDRSWPMPVFDDYKEQLRSEIADFTNTGGRAAGAITAALFLKEFTGGLPWVHIDIAGTAWAEDAKPYQPKGATGVAVRTLAHLALDVDGWGKLTVDR